MFSYSVTDGQGGSDTALCTVTVGATNDAPLPGADTAITDEDTPVLLPVLANDVDPDGDPLTIIAITPHP